MQANRQLLPRVRAWANQLIVQQAALGLICLSVLLRTMVPTIYTLDSAELTVGAYSLGIVHGPGYPLYLLLVKLLMELVPVGDIAYRANLFSALCLAGIAPLLYYILTTLLADRLLAASATLIGLWSRQIWLVGLYAEIYAPQMFTLTACCAGLVAVWQVRDHPVRLRRRTLIVGVLVGLMVAMAPANILFVPLVIVVLIGARVPWSWAALSGGVSLIIFAVLALYLPIRSAADPPINLAGEYTSAGEFQPYDLQSPAQLMWYLRGGQFDGMFFSTGFLSLRGMLHTLTWLGLNYLGIGVLAGAIGWWELYTQRRGLFGLCLLALLPYAYFFSHYGAPDVHTMLGPVFLIWTLPLAVGLRVLGTYYPGWLRRGLLIALPLILLVINFPLVDSSDDDSMREYAETLLADVPENAAIFGIWWEVTPLQYLQIVEDVRPDVVVFNFWQFHSWTVPDYVEINRVSNRRPIVVLTTVRDLLAEYGYAYIPLGSHDTLLDLTHGYVGSYLLLMPVSDAPGT